MSHRFPMLLLAAIVSILLAPSLAKSAGGRSPSRPLPLGVWGGNHIRMEVNSDGAELEFDCARGKISAPITLDAQGRFRLKGLYKRETPAPAAADADMSANAVYSGTLKGSTLHLEVSISGQSDVKSFDLAQGDQGTLAKCA